MFNLYALKKSKCIFFICNILILLIIILKWKKVRILKKSLNITFINPNTEEQIVQAMAGVLAYNMAEKDEKIKIKKRIKFKKEYVRRTEEKKKSKKDKNMKN